tara:strand:+ start:367 stop:468 length:102 start_codon:yes stop_codon:yes gene_type:complete
VKIKKIMGRVMKVPRFGYDLYWDEIEACTVEEV